MGTLCIPYYSAIYSGTFKTTALSKKIKDKSFDGTGFLSA
jgi:hypothetical protein